MKDTAIQIPFKQEPVLLDRVLQDMQTSLMSKLAWLDNAFGRAYKLIEFRTDGNKFVYPAAYTGDSEYISLLPNDNYGNFCWFDIYDPQKVTAVVQASPQYTFDGAIVFWYNLNSIYPNAQAMYTEEIKDEILRVLTSPGLISFTGKFTVHDIYERFENIYKGYSLEKIYNNFIYSGEDIQSIDKQFFMHPYAGIRIEFSIITRELCQRYIL